jgi:biotin carboxyl carrier protein
MKFFITLNRKRYEVFAEEIAGKLELTIDGKQVDVEIEEESQTDMAIVEPRRIMSETTKPHHSLVQATTPLPAASSGRILSPMAGVVLKISVKAGDVVKRGDVLIILEAMKMENEIRSNADGKIMEIKVSEGGRVNQGEILCVIG